MVDNNQNISKEKCKKLTLRFQGYTQLLNMEDIICFEYLSRKIFITTRDTVIEYIHMPLRKIKELLGDEFLQIHQSYIINVDFIEYVEFNSQRIKLTGINEKLPIGRTFLKKVVNRVNK